jgi:hypothetical protein
MGVPNVTPPTSALTDWKESRSQFAARILRTAKNSPIVQRRISAIGSIGSVGWGIATKIITPADALAERLITVAGLAEFPDKFRMLNQISADEALFKTESEFKFFLAKKINKAQVFLWRRSPTDGAMAMSLPDHVFGKEGWPHDVMWWTFEDAMVLEFVNGEVVRLQGFLAVANIEGVELVMISDTAADPSAEPEMVIHVERIEYGSRIIDDGSSWWQAAILKMVSFLNSKYVSANQQRMLRAERRSLLAAGMPAEVEKTVRVVELRTPEQSTEKSNGEGERDWAGRWWVRGHIRAQWCPSSKTHKLIYIAPHLKGPEDKPILPRMYHVAR